LDGKINLKELEKKAWTSYFNDGMWDLSWGLLVLTAGIRGLTNVTWFALGFIPAIMIILLGKKYVTIPRIGRVEFGSMRRRRQIRLGVLTIISVAATFTLLILTSTGIGIPAIPIYPIIAALIFVFFSLLGYYLDFPRLFIYGFLLALSEILWGIYGKPIAPLAETASGSLILVVGVVVLIRFTRKYPKPYGDELIEG
jgi:hypothetical protein